MCSKRSGTRMMVSCVGKAVMVAMEPKRVGHTLNSREKISINGKGRAERTTRLQKPSSISSITSKRKGNWRVLVNHEIWKDIHHN